MNFKEKLEAILIRYIPFDGDKESYDSLIKLLSIRIEELHEQTKEDK